MQAVSTGDFSTNLFWDVDPAELDFDRHRRFIVARVVEHGTFEDWKILCRQYTVPAVIETARTLRSLDAKTLAFLATVGHVPRESFRCCTATSSPPAPWIC